MPIIIDYEMVRRLIIQAANEYLTGKNLDADDGIMHGQEGIRRAKKVKNYLENCVGNHKAIIAILLAVVEKPNFFAMWGYSSRLAGLIARKIIMGRSYSYFLNHANTLRSNVISLNYLSVITRNSHNETWDAAGEGLYFNHLKGLRHLMTLVLKEDFNSQEEREEIQRAANELKANFKKNDEINGEVSIDLSLLPGCEMRNYVADQPRI